MPRTTACARGVAAVGAALTGKQRLAARPEPPVAIGRARWRLHRLPDRRWPPVPAARAIGQPEAARSARELGAWRSRNPPMRSRPTLTSGSDRCDDGQLLEYGNRLLVGFNIRLEHAPWT